MRQSCPPDMKRCQPDTGADGTESFDQYGPYWGNDGPRHRAGPLVNCPARHGKVGSRITTRQEVRTKVIEFLCPNGHPIHCRDEQAGRAAKCPRCGVKFRIPELAEATSAPPVLADSDAMEPEAVPTALPATDMALPAGSPVSDGTPSDADPQIEFVCPNGHRLQGPANLRGQPGECPACGSKFRIPGYDNVSDQEETELEEAIAGTIEGEGPDIVLPRLEDIEEIDSPDASGESPPPDTDAEISSMDQPGPGAATHPLAEVLARLGLP